MNEIRDRAYLHMAFSLAEKAAGQVSPNPLVGAVVVKDGRIVGSGWHAGPGYPHAEIVALDRAGRDARGADVFITLEPCTHWGRTPPCIDRLLKEKPGRVVISDIDPNPKVNGRGIARLREAGIPVSTGLLAERNRLLNECYIKHITTRRPFLILKAALSLDGKMATATGNSQWISSPAARNHIHLVRGMCDAILIGSGTILQDDPRLTVRHPLWKSKRIHRVCLDSRLRIPPGARLLDTLEQGPVMILTLSSAPKERAAALRRKGAEIVELPGTRIRIEDVLDFLGRRELTAVLAEGGARLHTSLLESGLVDKVLFTFSPKLIGGVSALSPFLGAGAARVADALRLKKIRCFQIEDDMIFEGYL